ncbi:DUF6600 domain-containing protein [Acidisoma sp. C75]
MSFRARWSLLPSVLAGISLAASPFAGNPAAFAQQVAAPPPPPGAAAPAAADAGTPPARVGWLSNIAGAVSFHSADQTEWTAATQNYPFATGDALWTQPQAQASIFLDSSRIALNGGTEFTAQEIDQETAAAVLSQGEIFLNLVALQNGQSFTIQTPRGTAEIATSGQYEIYAGDSTTPTYITVVSGALQFTPLGQSAPQTVGPQQTLVVSGTDPVQSQLGAMQQDQFLTAMLRQVAPPPPPGAVSAPPVTAEMTGTSVLAQYGSWQAQPSVGAVWFPQVASNWVPYRDGRWAYIQPWGWTWVDNDPWGFAPFHYGRWAEFGGRWGWVPAPAIDPGYRYASYQPVYAPALVTFLGIAAGAVTAAALSSGSIGWAPLGLREPYYPPYAVPPRYFNAYNRPYMPDYNRFYQQNITVVNNRIDYRNAQIINNQQSFNIVNRRGATFAPVAAMVGSRPIGPEAHALPPGARLAPFTPGALPRQLPRPTAATWGLTPALAAREHLPPGPPGAAPRPPAPGPAIRAGAFAPGRRGPAPQLVPHAAVAPRFAPGVPGAVGHPPGQGLPGFAPAAAPLHAGLPPGAPHAARPMPGNQRPGGPMPGSQHPFAQHALPPLPQAGAAPGAPHPAFRPAAPGGMPNLAAPGNGAHPQAARPAAPQQEAPRPGAPRPAAPQPAAPQPAAPQPGGPRPMPQMNHQPMPAPNAPQARPAFTPAPHMAAPPRPAPAPRMAAPPRPAPAPQMAAPRMPAPAPRMVAPPRPAPAPRMAAPPRPAPAPRMAAPPRPAPAPHMAAPQPAPHGQPPRPPGH